MSTRDMPMRSAQTKQFRYRELRRRHPMMPASSALACARLEAPAVDWSGDGDILEAERDGFEIRATAEQESIYPKPGDGLGEYVREDDEFPLGLPARCFDIRPWTRGDGYSHFIPDNLEDEFEFYRRAGQTRAVALELVRANLEEVLSGFFGSPLTYYDVRVTASRAGVELGSSSCGTSILEDGDGYRYLKELAAELVDEAISEARARLEELCAA